MAAPSAVITVRTSHNGMLTMMPNSWTLAGSRFCRTKATTSTTMTAARMRRGLMTDDVLEPVVAMTRSLAPGGAPGQGPPR